MTAPLRRNGQLVTIIERGCEHKRRYSDEWGARGAGASQQEETGYRMWIYPCKLCRGYHLTRSRQGDPKRAADYQFKPTRKDAL